MNGRLWLAVVVAVVWAVLAGSVAAQVTDRAEQYEQLRGLARRPTQQRVEYWQAQAAELSAVERVLLEVAEARLAYDADAAGRRAAAERVFERRRAGVGGIDAPAQRAAWLLDHAEEVYVLLLPVDGAKILAEFGVATGDAAEIAARVGREMRELGIAAEREVQRAIAELEARPGFASDVMAQRERRLLVEEERMRRLPLVMGIGAYLTAMHGTTTDAERRSLLEEAAGLLQGAQEILEQRARQDARVYSGLALARLGRFDEAEAMFRAAATDDEATDAERFMARMGAVVNRTRSGGVNAGLRGLDEVEPRYGDEAMSWFRWVIVDHRFLLRKQAAETLAGEERKAALARAYAAYEEAYFKEQPSSRGRARMRLLASIDTAVGDAVQVEDQPAIVMFAKAHVLGRRAAASEASDAEWAEVQRLLELFLTQRDAGEEWRAWARLELAHALSQRGRYVEAAERYLAIATELGGHAVSEPAIMAAASAARQAMRQSPEDGNGRRLFKASIDTLLSRFPKLDREGRYRFMAAQLAWEEKRLDEASELLAEVESLEAARAAIEIPMMQLGVQIARDRAKQESQRMERREASRVLMTRIGEVAHRLERMNGQQNPEAVNQFRDILRLYQAEAHVMLDQPDRAVELLAGWEPAGAENLAGEVIRVRVLALSAAGKHEAAIEQLQRMVEVSPMHARQTLAGLAGELIEEIERERDTDPERAETRARDELAPLARMLGGVLALPGAEATANRRQRLVAADALRMAGLLQEAEGLYDELLVEQPHVIALVVGKAECVYGLGDDPAEAMTLYRRISADRAAAEDADYWLAQLRMLQILDRIGRNTEQILPRINMLRTRNKDFGGARFRKGFLELETKYRSGVFPAEAGKGD